MTQAKVQQLSDSEVQQLAEALVNARTEGDRTELMQLAQKLIDEGVLDPGRLKTAIEKLMKAQSAERDKTLAKQQAKPTKSAAPSEGVDRTKDKTLVLSFKWLRGLVLVTNVMPYRVILTNLLPQTVAAEIYGFVAKMPLLGVLLLTALATLLWYALQTLETLKGRNTWSIKALAYAADAFLCIATFPPLVGGFAAIGLFLTAGVFSDVDWANLMICVFAIGAWELLDYVEGVVFKGASFGFWGVKTK